MIWKQPFDMQTINNLGQNTMSHHLGITVTEAGDDYLVATMPVNEKTSQPFGILHGGASVVLAETLGSIASTLCLEDMEKETVVGLEINANHLRAVSKGYVTGTVRPIRIGRRVHVWAIEIVNEEGKPNCTSRLTTMVVKKNR